MILYSLSFLSEVSGTHDYAHLKLDEKLSDSWTMKFVFHIDDLEQHPRGKGILNLDPNLRQILFGIPAIFLPIIGYVITRNSKSISFFSFGSINKVLKLFDFSK